jgi:hypothetical protein
MSAPVDVLAYLDGLIAQHKALSADAYHVQELPKAEAARAAVAELIAADREYDAAKAHRIVADNTIARGVATDGNYVRQANAHHAYDRAVARRAAALARCGVTP